jgi:hypothetical protein
MSCWKKGINFGRVENRVWPFSLMQQNAARTRIYIGQEEHFGGTIADSKLSNADGRYRSGASCLCLLARR